MLACRRDWDGSMQPREEVGRSVQGLTGRTVTDVAGVVARDLKSVEKEMCLDAGVVLAGVENSGAVVDEQY